MTQRARTLSLLLVLVSAASGQEGDPGFPGSGKHFEHLATMLPDTTIKEVLADAGVIVLKLKDAKGKSVVGHPLNLVIVDMNVKRILPASFSEVRSLGQGYITAHGARDWVLLHVPTKRTWTSQRMFGLLESGEVILRKSRSEGGKSFVCRAEGDKLTPISAPYDFVSSHGKGTFWAETDDMWGVVGVDGAIRIPLQFKRNSIAVGGYLVLELAVPKSALMNPKHPLRRSNRTGVLTSAGRPVLPFDYDWINDPVGGVCSWSRGKKSGATDLKTGKVLLEVEDGLLGNYGIQNVDGKWFLVKRSESREALASKYSYRLFQVGQGYRTKDWHDRIDFHATPDGLLFSLQKTEQGPRQLCDAQLRVIDEDIAKVVPAGALLAVVPSKAGNRKPYLVDGSGKVVVDSQSFTGSVPRKGTQYNGRIPTVDQGLYGYVDMAGKPAIAAKYKSVDYFTSGGIATVRTDAGWGVIDRSGNNVVEPKLADALCFPDHPFFLLVTDDSVSLHDKTGEEFFKAPKRFRLDMVTHDRLSVTEIVDKKLVRWFLFALK